MDRDVTILLLEDDDLISSMFSEIIGKEGFKIESFTTGKEALQAISNKKYNVLLLDIMLPDTNGLEILKKARQSSPNSQSKIAILTNLGQDTIIQEARNLGADTVLIKSAFNPDELMIEIKKLIAESQIA